jgi:hypothetical protein
MEIVTSRKIVYLNNPNIENDMQDEYSYFPDKPQSSILSKPSSLNLNKGFEPTKTEFKLPEFKLTKDKKDTVIPQLRTETKTDLRKETFGTKNPIVETTTEEEEVFSKKEGMSLGVKIGIGVGALVILGLGVYLIRKNK